MRDRRSSDSRQFRAQLRLQTYFLPLILFVGAAAKLVIASRLLECCGPYDRLPLLANLVALLWLSIPLLWLGARTRLTAAMVLSAVITLVVLGDLVHARFYGDPASVSELGHAWQLYNEGGTLASRLRVEDSLLFLDLGDVILLGIVSGVFRLPNGSHPSRALRLGSVALVCILSIPPLQLAARDPDGVFEFSVGRRQVVNVIGLAGYHLHDLAVHTRYRIFGRWGIDSSAVTQLAETIRRHNIKSAQPELFGVARGANLIVIQAESLQAFPLDIQIDGRFIMPNLRALAQESVSATNFFGQAAEGNTSDAVFTTLQSLHPISAGAVATRYPTNRYYALPTMFNDNGFSTVAFSGAPGEFWNLRLLLQQLGVSSSCFDCPALTGLRFGQGLADGDFFRGVLRELPKQRQPFFAFLMTMSNHQPFELPTVLNPLPVGRLTGTLLGRYLQTAHYFDQSLGEFLRGLAESGLLDRSVLVVYGDHHGYLGSPAELPQLIDLPPHLPIRQWEANRRLPFVIRLPHAATAGGRQRAVGHLDIAPTLLSLFGIEVPDSVMLGRSLFDDRPPLVIFRDGSFVRNNGYVLTQPDPLVDSDDRRAGAGCYDPGKGTRAACEEFENARRTAIDQLRLSDLILRGDLIPQIRDRLRQGPR